MIIDIHGHITTPSVFKKYPMPPSLADVGGMLERKAEAGIGLTIVGSPVGGGAMMRVTGAANYAQSADDLAAFHDELAELASAHPGRLKAYVYTNPLGGDGLLSAAAETLRGDDTFIGFIVNTSVEGQFLDIPQADSFFAMAAELDVPVLLHPPAEPAGNATVADFRLVEQVGRFNDVTLGLASIVFGGWLEKYPSLQLIAATAGGGISLLPEKLDVAYAPKHWGPAANAPPGGGPPPKAGAGPPPWMQYENKISQPPSQHLRRLYVDTASPSPMVLQANVQVLGATQMMFGTDAPPLLAPLQAGIDAVHALPISDEERQAILGGNARRVFKLADDAGAVAAAAERPGDR